MKLDLDLQVACCAQNLPTEEQFRQWLSTALVACERSDAEVTVRLVEPDESQALNGQYRGKDKPTNVLSFSFEAPPGITLNLLGDLIICADVVEQEAKQQNKPITNHWAHMTVHGCLHLLGYDHIENTQAEQMEQLEIHILSQLGIDDPYQDH